MSKKNGEKVAFEKSWQTKDEAYYTHWTRSKPENQIQFVFRNHWILFNELMEDEYFNNGKRCLEVGCGRGTLSTYFSDAEFECTLLDYSEKALNLAQEIFKRNQLNALFKVGDANKLPFKDNSFDIVFSIGLLEHFENINLPIKEQIRVLDKRGIFIGYVVPKYTNNIQKNYDWVNDILKGYASENEKIKLPLKEKIYRSDDDSKKYIEIMKKYKLQKIHSSGVYSLPMISHSIEFPFTLMPKNSEKALVAHFKKILEKRKKESEKNPWLCEEGYGQAFLVWGFK